MSYSYSGSVEHVRRPAADDGRGSFGPVFLVLAVISFLSVAACVAGRVCGRRSSSAAVGGKSSPEQQSAAAEAEKAGFGGGANHMAAIMRPVASSRATVHDVDDAFEIKLLPPNPAAREAAAGGVRMQAPPPPPQRLGLPPRLFTAATPGAAGFRGPPGANGAVPRQAHPPVRSGAPFVPAQQCK